LKEKKDRMQRLSTGKKYTPLYLRQKGRKKCFDEENGDALMPQKPY
jgi:hypothetical protein